MDPMDMIPGGRHPRRPPAPPDKAPLSALRVAPPGVPPPPPGQTSMTQTTGEDLPVGKVRPSLRQPLPSTVAKLNADEPPCPAFHSPFSPMPPRGFGLPQEARFGLIGGAVRHHLLEGDQASPPHGQAKRLRPDPSMPSEFDAGLNVLVLYHYLYLPSPRVL